MDPHIGAAMATVANLYDSGTEEARCVVYSIAIAAKRGVSGSGSEIQKQRAVPTDFEGQLLMAQSGQNLPILTAEAVIQKLVHQPGHPAAYFCPAVWRIGILNA
jgi:hypothetical protein